MLKGHLAEAAFQIFFFPVNEFSHSGCILEVSKKFSNGEEKIQAIGLKLVSLHAGKNYLPGRSMRVKQPPKGSNGNFIS